MYKKRKIDFILNERRGYRLIFRFYPKRSSCHSFNENPPKSWNEVYKVYYSYAILEEYDDLHYFEDDKYSETEHDWNVKQVFDESSDECSCIDEVGFTCLQLAEGKTEYSREINGELHTWQLLDTEKFPFGDGTSWKIHKYQIWIDEDTAEDRYEIQMFDKKNIGYRFSLNLKQLKEFGQYLLDCCEYMLAHGESI